MNSENRNNNSNNLDTFSINEILQLMNREDFNTVLAVKKALPEIEIVCEQMVETLKYGGRIIYAGAGTSGRLGLLDAVECGPTFSCDKEFIALLAGGEKAIIKAVEGAEDDVDLCQKDLKAINFNNLDLLICISASGSTPYCIGGINYAKKLGIKTACICCNLNSKIASLVDYPIEVFPGEEILSGSTRLKSGTCEKMILNMLSTASMVKLSKVYSNLMVDVKATNNKLYKRCRNIVMEATGCNYDLANKTLQITDNNCKQAIVMIKLGITKDEAIKKLFETNGNVRMVIEQWIK